MSSCKSSKTELVAIYRLEFYKKQKNWKFCTSRQDKKKSPKKHVEKKTNLNTTYNIQSAGVKESSNLLNVAFIDTDSDKNQPIQPHLSKNCELSQEWQEPVDIWPAREIGSAQQHVTHEECGSHTDNCDSCEDPCDKPKKIFAMQRLKELYQAAKLDGYEQEQNTQNLMKETELYPQEHGRMDVYENGRDMDWQCCSEYYCNNYCDEDKWPMQSGLMIGASHMAQDIWCGELEADVPDGGFPEDAASSPAWSRASCTDTRPAVAAGMLDTGEWCDISVDSVGEFMRGADAAPHSSEIDLSLPTSVDISDVSFTSLSRLSSQQLFHAAKLHSRVLRKLLLEGEQRQRLRDLARLTPEVNSFEEYPTRDTGPHAPPPPPGFRVEDVFVAGSHALARGGGGAPAGRGRGRLPDFC